MAQLELDGATVTVRLSALEKVEALHRDVSFPSSAVRTARAVPNALAEVHGLRLPGTGVPGLLLVGTFLAAGTRTFAVCHGSGPGVVLDLHDEPFDRLVLSCDDPQETLATLR